MNIAITCDYLLERNHYIEVVELICEIFPEAKLYCFAHREGMILGHIEMRKITSSYLSKKIKTEDEFYSHSYQIPSLAKNIFVSCEYDLIINISKGFSQGFKRCDKAKIITYLYDFGFENKIKKSFVQKLFYSFVITWVKKTLKKSDMVLVSRADLLNDVRPFLPNAEVVPPPFRVSDYSLFPKSMFKHHFFAVETTGLNVEEAGQLITWMNEWEIPFQFIGNDEHLASLKAGAEGNKFFGNRCSGEHAPVLAASKALISFNNQEFPNLVLATMATGRPVIVGNDLKKWVSGTGTYFVSFTKNSLRAMIDEVNNNEELLDGQKIRAHVMEYHDIKFKAHMKRVIEKFTNIA